MDVLDSIHRAGMNSLFETVGSFGKAFYVSSQIGEVVGESVHDWAIRALNILNDKFPELDYADVANPMTIRARREWIVTTFMIIYKIADKIDSPDKEYFHEIHSHMREVSGKTSLGVFSMLKWELSGFSAQKELFYMYREAIHVLTLFRDTGKLEKFRDVTKLMNG